MSNRESTANTYTCHDIQVLEGLEPVRRRPGMYIGDLRDRSGLHHMVWEVVGNAIDEHLAGHCRFVVVTVERDGTVSVEDDGRGIPIEPVRHGKSVLELVMTQLHVGATFDNHVRHVHVGAGLHGLGLAPINALSERLVATIARCGRLYRQEYRRGVAQGRIACLGETSKRGTHIAFRPDETLFSPADVDASVIRTRLRELSHLLPGLKLRFVDRRIDFESRGLGDLAGELSAGLSPVQPAPMQARVQRGNVDVEVALFFARRPRPAPQLHGFVNLRRCDEGTHVAALTAPVNALLEDAPPADRKRLARRLRSQLGGVVSVLHFDPSFDSPTRSKLSSPDVAPVACDAVEEAIRRFQRESPEVARTLVLDAWKTLSQ